MRTRLILNNNCIVCHSNRSTLIYPGILKCDDCDYVFANLKLSQSDFELLYSSDYFNGEEYSDYLTDRVNHERNFKLRLKQLNKYIDLSKYNSLLEIGCAYGFFLNLVKNRFERVVGVDVTSSGISYAKDKLQLDVYKSDLLKWDFKGKNFNIACMWDVIEHLKSPDLYLEKISKNMASGGVIALTTGDIDSIMAKLRGKRWRLIHPPTHAHYFSKNTLTRLLDRYGYDVVNIEYCGSYRSIDNIAYNIFVLRLKIPFIYKILKNIRITSLSVYLNLYDIMYVIAKKR